MYKIYFILFSLVLFGCNEKDSSPSLYTLLDSKESGIDFKNMLAYDKDFNIYTYRNFYNGGGVAIGDINNDGLEDIYFSANMSDNTLYLNKGNLQFEDITASSGTAGEKGWSTGVSMVDINGDGYLDIYVCNSGDVQGDNKENELFINNGDGSFTDQAKQYGLADKGFSTHAVFFDYDRDGDLDCYLLNNSYRAIGSFNQRVNEREVRDEVGGDKLLRNDNGYFTDVSESAGIYGSIIGFGLGITAGDVNRDGWIDLFISNDFFERDYLYINNQDGTFDEVLADQFRSISGASMGADMADLTGDGYPEIFVTEMLPEPNERLKTKTTFENWDKYQLNVNNGYHHQMTRNMLHRNNGDGTWSEIGRLYGVEATDWSWGALMHDMDLDGRQDLFVANGIYQDLTDQDFLQFISNQEIMRSVITDDGVDYAQLISYIPSEPISNYAFQGSENLPLKNKSQEWGLDQKSFSNGSAYGDLDNDGDLDLVINNVNMPAFVYRNNASDLHNHRSLNLSLEGKDGQTAIGAQVELTACGRAQYRTNIPNRGFQSSVTQRVHFGLGDCGSEVYEVSILWPSGQRTEHTISDTDRMVIIKETDGSPFQKIENSLSWLQKINVEHILHKENDYVDFDRDRMLYHMRSTLGPALAVADLNKDGLDDFYLGGAKGQAGIIYYQSKNKTFTPRSFDAFEKDKNSEDIDAVFFDVDNDNDLDLYVCSGGSDERSTSLSMIDRLYINTNGVFTKSSQLLPAGIPTFSSSVDAIDYDGDDDIDLIVGTLSADNQYGIPQPIYILNNNGDGTLSNIIRTKAPELSRAGLVTDVKWFDFNSDGREDVLYTGEWMGLEVALQQSDGSFKVDSTQELNQYRGFFNTMHIADINNDNQKDILLGNLGLNNRFNADKEHPLHCYVYDFDQNGSIEQIITQYEGDVAYPIALRHDLIKQLPHLKKSNVKYEDYRDKTIADLFPQEQLDKCLDHSINELRSLAFIANDNGFSKTELPLETQLSPIYDFLVADINNDGVTDILSGGNLHGVRPELGPYDASYGATFSMNGNTYNTTSAHESGFKVSGEIRAIKSLKSKDGNIILVARNNDHAIIFTTAEELQ